MEMSKTLTASLSLSLALSLLHLANRNQKTIEKCREIELDLHRETGKRR